MTKINKDNILFTVKLKLWRKGNKGIVWDGEHADYLTFNNKEEIIKSKSIKTNKIPKEFLIAQKRKHKKIK